MNGSMKKYRWGKRPKHKWGVNQRRERNHKSDLPVRFPKTEWQRRKEIVKAWAGYIEQKWDEGYDIYLFTFMFNELPGNQRAKLEQMTKEIYAFYSKLATRVARKPRSHIGFRFLPTMVLHPDIRGYKHKYERVSVAEAKVNDGLHFHGACASDRRGKIKQFLDEYFEEHQKMFTTRKLRMIHVRRVTHLPRFVTDYALAAAKRLWFDPGDHFLILPRSSDDMVSSRLLNRR